MLQINYTKGKYELTGNLELENANSLMSYFDTLMKYDSKITVSLKKLNYIDTSGVETLRELKRIANRHDKGFKILKKVNENISWILKEPKLDGIIKV